MAHYIPDEAEIDEVLRSQGDAHLAVFHHQHHHQLADATWNRVMQILERTQWWHINIRFREGHARVQRERIRAECERACSMYLKELWAASGHALDEVLICCCVAWVYEARGTLDAVGPARTNAVMTNCFETATLRLVAFMERYVAGNPRGHCVNPPADECQKLLCTLWHCATDRKQKKHDIGPRCLDNRSEGGRVSTPGVVVCCCALRKRQREDADDALVNDR